jgi:hypothetical protein
MASQKAVARMLPRDPMGYELMVMNLGSSGFAVPGRPVEVILTKRRVATPIKTNFPVFPAIFAPPFCWLNVKG